MSKKVSKARREQEKNIVQELLRSQDSDEGPIIPASVEPHPTLMVQTPDGRLMHDVVLTFKRSDVERMRQGYACLQCWEKFTEPFPETCVCGYTVRESQPWDFTLSFGGEVWHGSTVNLEDEQERIRDWDRGDKLKNKKRIASVYIPDWAKI